MCFGKNDLDFTLRRFDPSRSVGPHYRTDSPRAGRLPRIILQPPVTETLRGASNCRNIVLNGVICHVTGELWNVPEYRRKSHVRTRMGTWQSSSEAAKMRSRKVGKLGKSENSVKGPMHSSGNVSTYRYILVRLRTGKYSDMYRHKPQARFS